MKRLLAATLVLAIVGLAAAALAADKPNPTGTWKWEVNFNNQTRETTLKLKLDGNKLTGAIVGRDGQETAIKDAKFEDGTVSFSIVRERNGQTMTRKYTGKLSGDTITGKSESERDGQTQSRDWEAKRAVLAIPTGTWKWTVDRGGQTREMTLNLKLDGDKLSGAMLGRNNTETPIQDATCKDGEISFKVVRERQGVKMTSSYTGKLSGDTITGKISTERDGNTQSRDWEAKRAAAMPTGTWKWTVNFGGQTHEMALTLKSEGGNLTGTLARDGDETAIQDAKYKDGDLSFTVVREFNGQKMTFKYTGKVSDDTIKGKSEVERDGQTRSRDWEAKKG
jgi:hypothetical protein